MGDLAQLDEEIPRLQRDYIERVRQKETLVTDIASVNEKLRRIAADHSLKPQQETVYIQEDDDEVPLAQRLKREA